MHVFAFNRMSSRVFLSFRACCVMVLRVWSFHPMVSPTHHDCPLPSPGLRWKLTQAPFMSLSWTTFGTISESMPASINRLVCFR